MLSRKERQKRATKLTRSAVKRYGELKNRKARPALNQLILSVLYHLTSVRRATRALSELRRAFVDWNEIRVSHPAEVAAAVSSAPWALEAADCVVWLLKEVYELYNRMDLGFLSDLTPTQARSCLESLPMVPRHLADEVLLLSLGVPVLPFSAATARMCYRLGLLENRRPTLKNQRMLESTFEEEYYPALHLFFCDFADKLCAADEPLCSECPLKRDCKGAK